MNRAGMSIIPIEGTDTIVGCHEIALSCRDVQQTAKFYTDFVRMKLLKVKREKAGDEADSRDAIQAIFGTQDGNILSFREIAGNDEGMATPAWTHHLAFRVEARETVDSLKDAMMHAGLAVDGPVHRPPFYSIYFADPNGYRLEVTALVEAAGNDKYQPDERRAENVLRKWNADKESGFSEAS